MCNTRTVVGYPASSRVPRTVLPIHSGTTDISLSGTTVITFGRGVGECQGPNVALIITFVDKVVINRSGSIMANVYSLIGGGEFISGILITQITRYTNVATRNYRNTAQVLEVYQRNFTNLFFIV